MTDFETIRRTAFEIEGPREGSLEGRASVALKILAVLGFSGVVLAMFPAKTPVATLLTVAFNIAAAALASILLGVAVGLDRRRPWAAAVARPLLVLLIVFGVATMAVAWSEGLIRIPFDVGLAAWALLGPADVTPVARQERRSVALAGAALLALAVMLSSKQLFSWGGVFDVHEPDLRVALAADCTTAGTSLPGRITLTYEWSWTSTAPLPSGTDIVVIGWTGADALGRPLYVIDSIPDSGTGVYSGRTGYPSTPMADEVARESQGSFRWALPLDEQQFAPGRIELLLRLARDAPEGPAPLTITATYVHLGIWRHAAATVTCAW